MPKSISDVYKEILIRDANKQQIKQELVKKEQKVYQEREKARLEYVNMVKNEKLTISTITNYAAVSAGGHRKINQFNLNYLYVISSQDPVDSSLQPNSIYSILKNDTDIISDNFVYDMSIFNGDYVAICGNKDDGQYYYIDGNTLSFGKFDISTVSSTGLTPISTVLTQPFYMCYFNTNDNIGTPSDGQSVLTNGFLYIDSDESDLYYVDMNGNSSMIQTFFYGSNITTSIMIWNNQLWASAYVFVFQYDAYQNEFGSDTYTVTVGDVPNVDMTAYKIFTVLELTNVGGNVYCIIGLQDQVDNTQPEIFIVAQLDMNTFEASYIRIADDIEFLFS